ncbi:HEAT repeat domain-containing protein [Pseudoflavitalea rhizosphaerae]|uniref:HEAT repeat domain-containing protein n=1 Tax=Pseudoflavitalea rhizosphaerae TaxID=1884793 RepID=UPI000F8EE35C|nr:HEAT repeat domain-containing protein [Pseudoflavitalea rhizosphaerae]
MMSKRISIPVLSICFALGTINAEAQQIEKPGIASPTSFAIVIDAGTYGSVKNEIIAYKKAVEKEGLGTYIVSHNWSKPDEIRTVLQKLYAQSPKLEGAVLVGDIPVPMVRDAQHMTSAFKMDQRRNWKSSSVPSDRYYDDFDLQFNFLKQDSAQKNLFYYALSPTSPQRIEMDIYTARIKPPVQKGENAVEKIRAYLNKVVAEKSKINPLNDFFVYTGHGYNSESLNAWAGEQISLREQFPDLFKPGNTIKFMNFRMDMHMKFTLMNEIQREELDMAIFHDHGSDDVQLLSGYPYVSNPQPSIENIRRYLRSKVRAAAERKGGDVEKTKKGFTESLGVPMAWMDDAFVDSVKIADSIFDASTDFAIPDIRNVQPNARFVMVDACLTGSLHLDDYMAGYYPFNNGKTIVALANSVGVLQDLWPDEMLGLLQYNVRTGNWMKHVAYLETHLFGDPTFRFAGNKSIDLNKAIVLQKNNAAYWETLLNHPSADVQCLAMEKIFRIKGVAASAMLRNKYFQSNYGVVRMEALKCLAQINNADFKTVLLAGCNDPYEFVRRQAAYLLSDIGSEEMIVPAVELYINDGHSKRVAGKAKDALDFMDTRKVKEMLPSIYAKHTHLHNGKEELEYLLKQQDYTAFKINRDMKVVMDKSKPVKERLAEITIFRNYNYHSEVPKLISLAIDPAEDLSVRTTVVEALGWFFHSYQKERIVSMCNELMAGSSTPEVLKLQAEKTRRILKEHNLSMK